MSSKLERLKKIDKNGKWGDGKVSELILEFAEPLLDVMQPGDIDGYRNAMMFATLCWNIPVFERAGDAEAKQVKRMFDDATARLPEVVVALLQGLVERRRTEFGHLPFYIVGEARGTTLDDCRIYAEARQPSTSGS